MSPEGAVEAMEQARRDWKRNEKIIRDSNNGSDRWDAQQAREALAVAYIKAFRYLYGGAVLP